MFNTVSICIVIACLFYYLLALRQNRKIKRMSDFLPLSSARPQIHTAEEFSAATVSSSISLATVIIAIFEFFPSRRCWLLWAVFTNVMGVFLVKGFLHRVWKKISTYRSRPTLHEFLGVECRSPRLTIFTAIFTSLGFLAALAMEMSAGSRFLGSLIPGTNPLLWVVFLDLFVLAYVGIGGYRAVVIAERIQMCSIYGFMGALTLVLISLAVRADVGAVKSEYWPLPKLFPYDAGLVPFLLSLVFLNVPSYLADMSIWQRIGGCGDEKVAIQGLKSSAIGATISWTWIVLLAFVCVLLISNPTQQNPLFCLLQQIEGGNFFCQILLAVMTLGLLGAALSSASSLLISAAHAIYEDIFCKFRPAVSDEHSAKEIVFIRLTMLFVTLVTMALVEGLTWLGFTLFDFVFALFGTQLSLFPPVIACLLLSGEVLNSIRYWIFAAIFFGFCAGWSTAIYGILRHSPDIVVNAPGISIGLSSVLVTMGYLISKRRQR